MTRLSKNVLKAPSAGTLAATAWRCSGQLTANTVVSASPCLLGAILVEIDDTGQDSVITVYDSPTSDTSDDEVLGIFTANGVAKQNSNLYVFPLPGVQAELGLYLTVAGDVKVYVYYR